MKLQAGTNGLVKAKVLLQALLAFGVVCFIVFSPAILDIVVFLGKRIPQVDVRTDYLKGLLLAILLGLTIGAWPVSSQDKKALWGLWAIKCVMMLGPMLVYEYTYQTDAFGYFSGARYDITQWKQMEMGWPNSPVVFIIWLHQHTFFDSFHASKVTFGMIGLLAIYIYYRAAVVFLRKERLMLLFIFGLFPSILFWSSTISKDPFVFLGIAVYCYGVIKWARTGSTASAMIMLSGIVLSAAIRYWLGFIIGIPALIVTLQMISVRNFRSRIIVSVMIVLVIAFFSSKVMHAFHLNSVKDLSTVANDKYAGFADGGSLVFEDKPRSEAAGVQSGAVVVKAPEAEALKPAPALNAAAKKAKKKFKGISDVFIFVPRGIFTVLFRPFPGEVPNAFGLLAGIEALVLFALFTFAVIRARFRKFKDPLVIWALSVILFWSAAYGFVSYNLGTVCRYRLQILPVFIGLMLYFAFMERGSLKSVKD